MSPQGVCSACGADLGAVNVELIREARQRGLELAHVVKLIEKLRAGHGDEKTGPIAALLSWRDRR